MFVTLNKPLELYSAFRKKTESKKIRFNKTLLLEEVENNLLILNPISSELKLWLGKSQIDWENKKFSEQEIEELTEGGFLVDEEFDEIEHFNQLKEIKYLMLKQNSGIYAEIYSTYACNARCFYCSEAGYDQRITMKDEVAKKIANLLIKKSHGQNIYFDWFGGEPLVGQRAIDIICKEIRDKGIIYKSSIISNGFLFDEKTVRKAKEEWKLNNAQITLDGTHEIYKKTKNYRSNPENPLETVLNGIRLLIESEIGVLVRLNVSHENHEDLKKLLEILSKRFNDKISVNIVPLFQVQDQSIEETEKLRENFVELIKIAIKNNQLNTKKLLNKRVWGGYCIVERGDGVCFSPDGNIVSCINPFKRSHLIGNVNEGIDPNYKFRETLKRRGQNFCGDCDVKVFCMLHHCRVKSKCSETFKWFITQPIKEAMINEYIKWKEYEDK